MKKLFLALALVASMGVAYAQKSDADIQKSIEKAVAAANDVKKGAKPAPWLKLGQAYVNAYTNPTANITQGIDKATFALMAGEKPVSVETAEIGGETYEKQVLSHANVYFNAAGQLAIVEVTKPSYDGDALAEAAKAYLTAYEKGAKVEDVDKALQGIANYYYNDAFNAYTFGDMAKASDLFKGAADVSMTAPCSVPNMDAAYNTAFTALAMKNYDRAVEYYNKCLKEGYTSEGNIYASLSECAMAAQDTLKAKNYLAEGLTAYPDNPSILTNLINLYLATKEDPAKIVELLDEAKKQMPDNPSLYYVEGNIYTGIKDYEKALAAYAKGNEISPDYDMAYYGAGTAYLKEGEDIVDEINALDVREWKKYDELQAKLNETYKKALVPFEKCYNVSTLPEVKAAAADFLKRLNFQLRSLGPEYQAAYEKWEAVVNEAQ